MPVLTNARHERFAQELAKGTAQRKAYELAGYKPSDQHASRLASSGKVRARVAELQAAVADAVTAQMAEAETVATRETIISVGTILDELEQARTLAVKLEMPHAMATASLGKAKLLGLIMKPAEPHRHNLHDLTVADQHHMTDAELLKLIVGSGSRTKAEVEAVIAMVRELNPYQISDRPLTPEEWIEQYGGHPPAETYEQWLARRHRELGTPPPGEETADELRARLARIEGQDSAPQAPAEPKLAAVTAEPKPAPSVKLSEPRPRRRVLS